MKEMMIEGLSLSTDDLVFDYGSVAAAILLHCHVDYFR